MPLLAIRRRLACVLVLCSGSGLAAEPAWPPTLEASLARAGIPRSATGVLVQDVDAATPLLSHHADTPMNPASVMKLVTSYVALEQLGPTFSWKTRLSGSGEIRERALQGPLFITGGGDPRLSRERLWLLLRELRLNGIWRLAGDVVTERTFFQLPPHDPGAFDQRPLRPYNAGADALSVDYGAIRLRLVPTPGGVEALIDPHPSGLILANHIRRSADSACGDPLAQLTASSADTPEGPLLSLSGSLPQGCRETFDWLLAPLSPAQLFEAQFRTLWREMGGEIEGRFRNGATPPDARVLAESVSPSLPEVLRDMNKWSNNVIARHLLATLGTLNEAGPDAASAGARVVGLTLARKGISTEGLSVENGAGLSRSERITPRTLGELLVTAWHGPLMPELVSSLPIAGRDGTARRRVANSPAAGFAHVKTGTLDGVRSLAGYVLARNGHRYAIVLMINHPNAGAARDAQDALLEWVAGL